MHPGKQESKGQPALERTKSSKRTIHFIPHLRSYHLDGNLQDWWPLKHGAIACMTWMVNILQQAGTPQFAALGCYANACISGVFIINIFILSSKIHARGKFEPGSSGRVAELYKRKESGW